MAIFNLTSGNDVFPVAQDNSGDDEIFGLAGDDLLDGGLGNDLIEGGEGNDTLVGVFGDETLDGGAGDDTVFVSAGDHDLDGGTGTDVLTVSGTDGGFGLDGLNFNAAFGTYTTGLVSSATFTRFEAYSVSGTANNDTITTGRLADLLAGGAGNDTLIASAGNDILDGGTGTDSLEAGNGNDTLFAGTLDDVAAQEADLLYGGRNDDLLVIDTPVDGLVELLTYEDWVFNGGSGEDTLAFEHAHATLDLTGAAISGIETLTHDSDEGFGLILTASQANGLDAIELGEGFLSFLDDRAVVMRAELTLSEIRMADGGQTLTMTGSSTPGSDNFVRIVGGSGNDFITMTSQNDSVDGGDGNDFIRGNGGADSLDGGGARDTIRGGSGDDVIDGGLERDQLSGELGSDTFVFSDLSHSSSNNLLADVITDFVVGDDVVSLELLDANADGGTPDDAFTFIGTDAFTEAGQVRVRQVGLDTVIEINVTGVDGVDMAIRLTGIDATTVTATDFLL